MERRYHGEEMIQPTELGKPTKHADLIWVNQQY
jgi:hypothetical protein